MLTEEQMQEEVARIRMPRTGEIFGLAVQMLGANKIRVDCDDGNTRICRITGKMRKRIWVNLGDLILIEPWKVQSNERADIIWKYTKTQSNFLFKKGYVKNIRRD